MGQRLFNGIDLPSPWPPRDRPLSNAVLTPPYLTNRPSVVPIDGRGQLFVDAFLIASTTMTRTWHTPAPYPGNPVIPREGPEVETFCIPFSDGLWLDRIDGLYKCWYLSETGTVAGRYGRMSLATSPDGITWTKPVLDVVPGTNAVIDLTSTLELRDSGTVWIDENDTPSRRYKALINQTLKSDTSNWRLTLYYSADGVHWGQPVARGPGTGILSDRSTCFYNPFRQKWVIGVRDIVAPVNRLRRYVEGDDLVAALSSWAALTDLPYWWMSDTLDRVYPGADGTACDLYNLDCREYKSVLLGLFSIHSGNVASQGKINEVYVGFSRDGFHWDRGNRTPIATVGQALADWNFANVQSVGGCYLIVGDQIRFYTSGRNNVNATGMYMLRVDGWCSMDSDATERQLTTVPLAPTGRRLLVNAKVTGALRAEVQDLAGRPIGRFTKALCIPATGDSPGQPIRWVGNPSFESISQPLQIVFYGQNAHFYSFAFDGGSNA